jgi:hypothetical protein
VSSSTTVAPTLHTSDAVLGGAISITCRRRRHRKGEGGKGGVHLNHPDASAAH